jgi:hypothetical protein
VLVPEGQELEEEFLSDAVDAFSAPVPLPDLTRMLDRLWEDDNSI